MSTDLKDIQEHLKNAVTINDATFLKLANNKAEEFRIAAKEISQNLGHDELATAVQIKFNEYYALAVETADIMMGTITGDASEKIQRMIPILQALEKTLDEASAQASKDFEESLNIRPILLINALFAVIAIILLSIVGYSFSNSIGGGISKGVELASSVAQGNLKHQIEVRSNDEVGLLSKHLNEMSANLREMLNKVKDAANSITDAIDVIDTAKLAKGSSAQVKAVEGIALTINQTNSSIRNIAGASESLSLSTSESSSSILEMIASIGEVAENASSLAALVDNISASIEETSAAVNQTAQNIETVFLSSEETSATVNEFSATLKNIEHIVDESAALSEKVKEDAFVLGTASIDKTISGMSKISDSVDSTMIVLQKLGERSSQIGNILSVINNVTEQTSLLSLNAAIIAAQAGEHGKGFAVVADAIKDLASQTASSTKDIGALIKAIQSEIQALLTSMSQVSGNAVAGVGFARETGDVLKNIVESAGLSSQIALQIQKATREQMIGVVQINNNSAKITEMISQIATATKEQRKTSVSVISSLDGLREISRRVKSATIEQQKGGSQISNAVTLVNQKVDAIVHGTIEQKKGSEQISASMDEIKVISQQNLAFASDVTASIETLSRQVDTLTNEVSRFNI
ncbi:MAG: methyl-accepting chemotaxis protein [Deltaproteobacteria bacterium]